MGWGLRIVRQEEKEYQLIPVSITQQHVCVLYSKLAYASDLSRAQLVHHEREEACTERERARSRAGSRGYQIDFWKLK